MQSTLEQLRFLNPTQVRNLAQQHGTPIYVTSISELEHSIKAITSVQTTTPIRTRYAMKANPHPRILKMMTQHDIWFDASSSQEVFHAIEAGCKPEHILLNSQLLDDDFVQIFKQGTLIALTSLHQIEMFGKALPGSEISVRVNPGHTSGHHKKVSTAGTTAAFGIWHEHIPQMLDLANKYDLKITQVNTHIGCGTDPAEWMKVADINLTLLEQLTDIKTVNMGGGFKVARMSSEETVDMQEVLTQLDEKVQKWTRETGRKISIEIEPGTYLVANSTAIIANVGDITNTGADGYTFLRINTGMSDILRPAMYGSTHPIIIVSKDDSDQERAEKNYVVAGRCCESSDVFTVTPDGAHNLSPRALHEAAIGDFVVIEGAGAYCQSMSAIGYNGYPPTKAVFVE